MRRAELYHNICYNTAHEGKRLHSARHILRCLSGRGETVRFAFQETLAGLPVRTGASNGNRNRERRPKGCRKRVRQDHRDGTGQELVSDAGGRAGANRDALCSSFDERLPVERPRRYGRFPETAGAGRDVRRRQSPPEPQPEGTHTLARHRSARISQEYGLLRDVPNRDLAERLSSGTGATEQKRLGV